MSQAALSDISDGGAFELSNIIGKSPLHGRDRTSNASRNNVSPRTALPTLEDQFAELLPLEETVARLKSKRSPDSAVSLTSLNATTSDRESKKNSVPKRRDKDDYPDAVERTPTPALSVKRNKRTSGSTIITVPPSPDPSTSASTYGDDEDFPPEVPPLPMGLDAPPMFHTPNPKVARVRSGRNMTVNIPVNLRQPNPDHPASAAGSGSLAPPSINSTSRNTLARSHTRSGSAPIDTHFAELTGDDLSRWTRIEADLSAYDIPSDALSPPQITELMRVSASDPPALPALYAKLAKMHQADAFEHVTLPDDDTAAPKMYTYRYTHAAPLGEVYTYHPPSPERSVRTGTGKEEAQSQTKPTVKELVKGGREWGRTSHKARVCKMGYAVIAGLGVIGAIVAVCYFRIGQGKKSFAHET